MENVLVTGGAGFVGTNLIKSLKEKYSDINITSLDNESYPLNLFEDDDATLHRIYFPFIV